MKARFTGERSEAGETLVELLISIMLIGLVVVAILGGLATTVLGSGVHRDQAEGNTVLVQAVEALKSTAVTRVACEPATDTLPSAARAAYLLAARTALPAGWPASALTMSSVKFQKVSSSGGTAVVTFVDDECLDDGTTGLTLQQITLRLEVPGDRVVSELTFLKGDE